MSGRARGQHSKSIPTHRQREPCLSSPSPSFSRIRSRLSFRSSRLTETDCEHNTRAMSHVWCACGTALILEHANHRKKSDSSLFRRRGFRHQIKESLLLLLTLCPSFSCYCLPPVLFCMRRRADETQCCGSNRIFCRASDGALPPSLLPPRLTRGNSPECLARWDHGWRLPRRATERMMMVRFGERAL